MECDTWSTAVMSATVDSPEYSRAMMPVSAAAEGVAVIAGAVPPVRTGAVQTLISVPSDAVKCVTSTKGSPDESLTAQALAPPAFQRPTSTIRRSPAVTLVPGVTEMLLFPDPCALTCWTNAGTTAAAAAGAATTASVQPARSAATDTAAGRPRRRATARADNPGGLSSIFRPPSVTARDRMLTLGRTRPSLCWLTTIAMLPEFALASPG